MKMNNREKTREQSGELSDDVRRELMNAALDRKYDRWLMDELYRGYIRARRGKRRSSDEFKFELNAVENLFLIQNDIKNRTYEPSRGIAFVIKEPVIREVFAAPFRDRVVHHFLYNGVYHWWDARLVYDSYSCREGKGTMFGIERLRHHIESASRQYTQRAYVIKMDLQGYFMSLPRVELYKKAVWGLDRQFPEGGREYETYKFLWRKIIMDDPCRGVRRKGRKSDWGSLPKSKSLFCQPPGQGIVIGNLSSQLLSNMYLDTFDRFVKFELGYKHYGRYVDDFFVVVTEEELSQALRDIEVMRDFLMGMGLTLHPNKRYIQEVRKGVEFLGVKVYPYHIKLGKRVVRNFKRAVREGQGLAAQPL